MQRPSQQSVAPNAQRRVAAHQSRFHFRGSACFYLSREGAPIQTHNIVAVDQQNALRFISGRFVFSVIKRLANPRANIIKAGDKVVVLGCDVNEMCIVCCCGDENRRLASSVICNDKPQ